MHPNEVVTTEQLVEQLFAGDVSRSAVNAVHAAVSRLRRVLHAGAGGQLVTRPGGYVLEVESDQLDSAKFEELLERGRRLLAAGDPVAASATLREALGLWRGPALADVAPLECVEPEIRRLEELRLLALTGRIDADVALDRHAELIGELESLIDANPLRERLRAQLMLALYRCGRQAEALTVYRDTSRLLRTELGLTPNQELRQLERMVLRQDAALSPARADLRQTRVGDGVVCPFKGLAFFDGPDADYYCGRDRIVSEVVARLAESTLVGILGPSGIGKSSLLRAGVLPALGAGALPRSGGWRRIVMRPGDHPCDELARAIGAGGLTAALLRLHPGERLVIAIDQLEELFTGRVDDAECAEFLDLLAALARDDERRVFVICVLRADFYGRFHAYERFGELLSHNHLLVAPMDHEELREAIERPAARAGLEVEPALVDALVAEVADEPGGLPLLSTALLELWQGREGRRLRFESYRRTGGIRGAVARMAEAAYGKLSEPERRVARNVMLRLAAADEPALARRRVSLSELEQVDNAQRVLGTLIDARLLTVGDGAVELCHEALLREWPRYRAWLEEDMIGRRLHAHLIEAAREWELRRRDPAELYRGARLASALEWAAQHRERLTSLEREFIDAGRLASERDASRQRRQNRRLRGLLAAVAVLLIAVVLAGIVALAKQRSAGRAARAAATEARAALGRQLGAEAVGEPRLDLAMLLAREAVSLNRSQETDGTLFTTLLRSPAVIGAFAVPIGSPLALALSPDDRTIAVGDGGDGTISFYDAVTHILRRALTDYAGGQPPVYSSDGAMLVYPTRVDGRTLLAVRDGHTLVLRNELALAGPASAPAMTAMPAGRILVAPDRRSVYDAYWVDGDGGQVSGAYLDRWTLPGGRLVSRTRIGDASLLAVRLVDVGTRLLAVSGRRISLIDVRTHRVIRSEAIRTMPAPPSAAAISPDGGTVAIGSPTGSVAFVDATDGSVLRLAQGPRTAIAAAFFSPDGRTVTTAAADGTVAVWSSGGSGPARTLTGAPGQIQSEAESQDGSTLYTASIGGDVLAWDLTGDRGFGRQARLGAGVPCCSVLTPRSPPLAISPDGSALAVRVGTSAVGVFSALTLQREREFAVGPRSGAITALAWSPAASETAVAGQAGLVQIWSIAGAPRLVRSLAGLHTATARPEAIQAVAFSPDGALLVGSDEDETRWTSGIPALSSAFLAEWRTDTGTLIAAPRDLEIGSGTGAFDAVAFSRSGTLLAASVPDGRVIVLDLSTGQITRTLDPSGGATSLAFAPDGTLATGTADGTVDLWDPATGQRLGAPLIADTTPITSVAFDPGGERFATAAAQDGLVKLWFTSTLQQEGPALRAQPGATAAVAFDPSGARLLAASGDGTGFVWPAALAAWEQRACSIAGNVASRRAWSRLLGGVRQTAACS